MPAARTARARSVPARLPRPALPTGREAARRTTGTAPTPDGAGNRAIGRLLAGAAPRMGGRHAPEEAGADRVAERVVSRGARSAEATKRPARGEKPRTRAPLHPGLGGGRMLPGHIRRRLGRQYDFDLSKVRLHTDADADRFTRSIGAQGASFGRDIFLRRDRVDLQTRSGLSVLAHELAHIGQGRGKAPILRRKDGLPDAAEAHTTADGSGAGWFFKGEWGTYRRQLDKYRDTPDKDTKKQAHYLRKLLVSSRKILAADRWSQKKKDFVIEQVPKIKLAYYTLVTKGQVFDAVESDAIAAESAKLAAIDAGIAERMKTIKTERQTARWKALKQTGDAPQYPWDVDVPMPEAPTRAALLGRLETAKVTINFPAHALSHWIKDSDFKQFWELENDKGPNTALRKGPIYAGQRDDAEEFMGYRDMYKADGTVDDLYRGTRPISAGLNLFNNSKGAAPGYGAWHFELKDAVKARCTYSSGDSIDQVKPRAGQTRADFYGTQDHLAGVLAGNTHVMDALFLEATSLDELNPLKTLKKAKDLAVSTQYIEVQVHGGISIDDVEALVIDKSETYPGQYKWADQWYAKYKSKGVSVRYV